MKFTKIFLSVLIVLNFLACKETKRVDLDSAWIHKKDLSSTEIIDSISAEVNRCISYKYTSQNTAQVNFYGGQKVKTFLIDKKGNALSNRNGQQYYRINGKVTCRNTTLSEDGLTATVIEDMMSNRGIDKLYFEKNAPYVKQNGLVNIEILKTCPFTTSVSGNTLTIFVSDLSNAGEQYLDKEYKKNVTITYTPEVGYESVTNIELPDKDPSKLIFGFQFNPDDEVELPTLLKVGRTLSAIKN